MNKQIIITIILSAYWTWFLSGLFSERVYPHQLTVCEKINHIQVRSIFFVDVVTVVCSDGTEHQLR